MRALAERSPVHYGWVIVAAAILTNSVTAGGTFWVVALYITSIPEDYGVSRTAVFGAFTVGQVLFAVIGPWIGGFIDRNGARRVLLVGSVAMPAALIATSFATALWQFYLGWIAASLARPFLMPIPYNWLVTRWFEGRSRQVSLGLVTTGFGMGGAVVLPIFAWIESASGWQQVMFASGVAIFVLHGLAAALIVANRPRDVGLRANGSVSDEDTDALEGGFDTREALRSAVFWCVSIGLMLFFLGQGSVNNLIVDFFDTHKVGAGATLLAATALMRTVMRPPLSLVLLRVDRVFLLGVAVALGQALATGALVATTATAGIAVWLVFWGFGGSFAPMIEPLLVTRAFGVRHYGAIAGLVSMISFGGQVLGPLGGAALFDLTDSYTIPFSLYTGGFLLAALLWATAAALMRGATFRAAAERSGLAEP
jgi:OFA family oxalate/formate antiporter-like MFS transporter